MSLPLVGIGRLPLAPMSLRVSTVEAAIARVALDGIICLGSDYWLGETASELRKG